MIKGFIFGFSFGLAVIFTGHNIYQYQKTFDNCLQLVTEIHRNLETLKIEIQTLQSSMQMMEVIYE